MADEASLFEEKDPYKGITNICANLYAKILTYHYYLNSLNVIFLPDFSRVWAKKPILPLIHLSLHFFNMDFFIEQFQHAK